MSLHLDLKPMDSRTKEGYLVVDSEALDKMGQKYKVYTVVGGG